MSSANILFTGEELACIHAAVTFEYSRLSDDIERGVVPAKQLADAQKGLVLCDAVLSKVESVSDSTYETAEHK